MRKKKRPPATRQGGYVTHWEACPPKILKVILGFPFSLTQLRLTMWSTEILGRKLARGKESITQGCWRKKGVRMGWGEAGRPPQIPGGQECLGRG